MDTKGKIALMQEQLAVMQAFVDGKTIQCRTKTPDNRDVWLNMSITPQWNWSDTDYRIKPEPEVVYVNRRNDRSGMYAYRTSKEAKEVVERFSNEKMYEYIAKKFVAVEE